MAGCLPLAFLASTSDDGLASWRLFVRGVESHVSGQQSLLAIVGVVIGVVVIAWVNVWVVRRLLRRESGSG